MCFFIKECGLTAYTCVLYVAQQLHLLGTPAGILAGIGCNCCSLQLWRWQLLCVRLLSVGFPHCCELSVPETSVRVVFLAAAQCKPRLWQWRSKDSSQLGSEAR